MTAEEIAKARRLIDRLELPDDRRKTRRLVASPHGKMIDTRRTFRRSLRSGGAVIDLELLTRFGLALVAVLIAYLPSIYSGFSRRESAVTHLSVRAGTPPSAVELLVRAHLAEFMHRLDDLFDQWETWFVDVEESHTTFTALIFFRSPNPQRSWITAAGALLDTAALSVSVLDQPFSTATGLCLRSGFLSLRAIA